MLTKARVNPAPFYVAPLAGAYAWGWKESGIRSVALLLS